MKTYRLSDNALNQLIEVEGINDVSVTKEGINRIREICYIGTIFSTEEELRGLRSGIVRDFYQMKESAYDEQKMELYWRLQAVMSATVAVIDSELLKRGYEV